MILSQLKSFVLFFILSLSLLSSCGGTSSSPHREQSKNTSKPNNQNKNKKAEASKLVSLTSLNKRGWNIPSINLNTLVPPQAGSNVLGLTVKANGNNDLPWTAFTLVLHIQKNANGSEVFEVLTQKRADNQGIETPGGHLTPGISWAKGALDELQQESGVGMGFKSSDLIPMDNHQPYLKISKTSGKLYGNARFFIVFEGGRPNTSNTSGEIDSQYGHKWLNLNELYLEMKDPTLKPKKYYWSFRDQVIYFYEKIYPKLGSLELNIIPQVNNWSPNVLYTWGANVNNYNLPEGASLNGGGMASPTGPSGGLAHNQYVGLVTTLKNGDTSASVSKINTKEVFPKLETHLRKAGNEIYIPVGGKQMKFALGTGLAVGQISSQDWCLIQKNIFENLVNLIDLGATLNIGNALAPIWPDHTSGNGPALPLQSTQDLKNILTYLKTQC